MIKKERVSDNEMLKWIEILGVNTFLNLYIEDKIILKSRQLNMLLNIKNGTKTYERTDIPQPKGNEMESKPQE